MKLMRKIRRAAQEAAETAGSGWETTPTTVIDAMLDEHDRRAGSRAAASTSTTRAASASASGRA